MKTRKLSLKGILFNFLIGAFVAALITGDVRYSLVGGLAWNILSAFLPGPIAGALNVGVNKEIWLPFILEDFYPVGDFLTDSVDLSMFVENDKLNYAEAGIDPEVLVNNTTYPVPTVPRTDSPLSMDLDTLDTKNTVVRSIEALEASYDKVESVTKGHKAQLLLTSQKLAAHGWAPSAQVANKSLINLATGADDGTGRLRLTYADMLKMRTFFDTLNAPEMNSRVLLHPKHKEDLLLDPALPGEVKAMLFNYQNAAVPISLAGFRIYNWSSQANFVVSTKTKVPYGAAFNPATMSAVNSIFYLSTEVSRADGTVDMFAKLKDPEQRGDIFGFQKRFLGLPLREKWVGAIMSNV